MSSVICVEYAKNIDKLRWHMYNENTEALIMKDRIKAVRKALNLTQQEFSDRLGIKRNAVANCEIGRSELSDSVISLICRTYNVSEIWLRTGEGDMFIPRSREDEIAAFLGDLAGGKGSDFQRRLVAAMARLSAEQWDVLAKIAEELGKEKDPE